MADFITKLPLAQGITNGYLAIVKAKGRRVVIEEVNEAIHDNVDRPGGRVVSRALHDNVLSGLEFGLAAGASKRVFGKKHWQYLPMGAWPVVMQVKRAHRVLVKPMMGSQEPPLVYVGMMTCCFSSSKSRNNWPFFWLVANVVCYSLRMSSTSFF